MKLQWPDYHFIQRKYVKFMLKMQCMYCVRDTPGTNTLIKSYFNLIVILLRLKFNLIFNIKVMPYV